MESTFHDFFHWDLDIIVTNVEMSGLILANFRIVDSDFAFVIFLKYFHDKVQMSNSTSNTNLPDEILTYSSRNHIPEFSFDRGKDWFSLDSETPFLCGGYFCFSSELASVTVSRDFQRFFESDFDFVTILKYFDDEQVSKSTSNNTYLIKLVKIVNNFRGIEITVLPTSSTLRLFHFFVSDIFKNFVASVSTSRVTLFCLYLHLAQRFARLSNLDSFEKFQAYFYEKQ